MKFQLQLFAEVHERARVLKSGCVSRKLDLHRLVAGRVANGLATNCRFGQPARCGTAERTAFFRAERCQINLLLGGA